ncbi:hypothetical protein ACVNS2_07045 [Paenibacillus caseinilyticus]|uniref:Uncharacterized protein n=1 Tax=Paenibacillus mucilaginosus K02 TaxID=997761 RepID=R9UMW7_9BACL|nr:hypothetical protein [Paenibacillus mucilaginosus]AGN70593.1 hypothetical protein B2K_38680 [Paenibacillus mucilaginosus K02]AGN70594.1 hypothetical protein B2K_38685 [Paenibacillus mucilaginosus K02]
MPKRPDRGPALKDLSQQQFCLSLPADLAPAKRIVAKHKEGSCVPKRPNRPRL